jgi:hypothetical protein
MSSDEAKLRKMTVEAMLKTKKFNATNTVGVADDANYFMPKIQKLRPDGASLTDVYASKRQDLWGQIIRAQVIEDVIIYPFVKVVITNNNVLGT